LTEGGIKVSNNLFNQVGGIVSVCLKGRHLEKLINLAMSRGIFIWDIKRKNNEELNFKVRSSAFNALKAIAEENNFELNIVEKRGLPFFKGRLKRRVGFISGAVLFILALYLMSSFIWFIEVSGNNNISTEEIMKACRENGVFRGSLKSSFVRNEVEEEILRRIPQLSYVEINIKGVRAEIKVVEKVLPQEEITGPCHIVAAKDGIVEDILVLEGQAVTRVGATVNKGDVLISGIIVPQVDNQFFNNSEMNNQNLLPVAVRARGTIKARVSYEGYGECELYTEKTSFTGAKVWQIALEYPHNKLVIIGSKSNPYQNALEETNKKILHTPWGDWAIVKTVYQEQLIEPIRYSEKEAIEIATQKAKENLGIEAEQINPEDLKITVLSRPSDSLVRVKALLERVEDIAQVQPIQ